MFYIQEQRETHKIIFRWTRKCFTYIHKCSSPTRVRRYFILKSVDDGLCVCVYVWVENSTSEEIFLHHDDVRVLVEGCTDTHTHTSVHIQTERYVKRRSCAVTEFRSEKQPSECFTRQQWIFRWKISEWSRRRTLSLIDLLREPTQSLASSLHHRRVASR